MPPSAEIMTRVFFDVAINGTEAGRIVMGMYGNVVPKTVKNFETLCRGDTMGVQNKKLAFANSSFHRIIPKFMIQGGDFTHHNGMGGMSIFGSKTFADENSRGLWGRDGWMGCGPTNRILRQSKRYTFRQNFHPPRRHPPTHHH